LYWLCVMALIVEEIMSHEVLSLAPSESVESALAYILALGITGAPVVDQGGDLIGMLSLRDLLHERHGDTVAECMNAPAVSITAKAPITEAGKLMGETGYHRLAVVDTKNQLVGLVSAIDVVRGVLGMPAVHPATSPHYDPGTGVSWTDDRVLEMERVEAAPEGPGILMLVRGGAGVEESLVWAEAAKNVRKRLIDIILQPSRQSLELQRVLALRELRFRTARVEERAQRERLVVGLLDQIRSSPRN
jgi:CBS domain-containing protein